MSEWSEPLGLDQRGVHSTFMLLLTLMRNAPMNADPTIAITRLNFCAANCAPIPALKSYDRFSG